MRRLGTIVMLGVLLSGCATVQPGVTKNVTVTVAEPSMLPAAALGMRRDAILPLLERDAVTGYEQDAVTGEFRPRTTKALYSTEMVEAGGISYLVDYYIVTDVKSGKPGESDLCPLIYQKDILVGKGRAELEALKAKSGE
ncbi:MAG: hypothetical protein HGA80_06400 [Candidatus Omnitrophica bacterium]|nr:hypothetical protein [Candidatus Omnitrophota bacterium]